MRSVFLAILFILTIFVLVACATMSTTYCDKYFGPWKEECVKQKRLEQELYMKNRYPLHERY